MLFLFIGLICVLLSRQSVCLLLSVLQYLKVVSEKWGPSSVEVTLQQAWFLADGSSGSEGLGEGQEEPVWRVPLLVASSTCVSEKAVIMEHKVQSFTVPLAGEGDWLKINAGQQALVRVVSGDASCCFRVLHTA